MADAQGVANRQHIAGNVGGVLVKYGTGTTDASANAEELVTHGAVDHNGNAYPAANLAALAIPTTNEAFIYENAAPTATVLDFRSTGTAVPYKWFLFLVNV
jgi:hypothetical protein